MTILLLGIALFFAIHVVPMRPLWRARLAARFGENGYKGIFTLVSLAGFGLLVAGYAQAPFVPVYAPSAWSYVLANFLMPVSFSLLAAAYLPNNFRSIVRHPMLAGVAVWSFAHLFANGDLASLLLFGSFGLYAIVDTVSATARGTAQPKRRVPLYNDALVLVVGLLAFWIVRYFHAALFGVAAMVG